MILEGRYRKVEKHGSLYINEGVEIIAEKCRAAYDTGRSSYGLN